MGRAPCCEKVGLKRGPWTPDEDVKLINYISEHGHGSWRALPKKAGLLRCGKSCRLRWTNYLRPDIKRGEFSASEEQSIIHLHALLGNRWSTIASHLPKRTDNEIKNYWNTHLKKKLAKMGIDPTTHKRKMELLPSGNGITGESDSGNTTLGHMAQWESARLEAEARLARESKLRAQGLWPKPVTPISGHLYMLGTISREQQYCFPTLHELKLDISSVELFTSFQNWKKSLQGQAGFLWPDSWKSNIVDGEHCLPLVEQSCHELSSTTCNSSPQPTATTTASSTATATSSLKLDHGSPNSTLCSSHQSSFYPHDSRRLYWNDSLRSSSSELLQLPYAQHASYGEAMSSRDEDEANILRAGNDVDEFDGKLDTLGLPCLQDAMFDSVRAWLPQIPPECSMFLTGSDSQPSQMKSQDEEQVNFAALSSHKCSYSPTVDDENDDAIPDLPVMVNGGSSSLSSAGRPVSFSALLTEDFPDYWNSMLEDDADNVSMEQGVDSAI